MEFSKMKVFLCAVFMVCQPFLSEGVPQFGAIYTRWGSKTCRSGSTLIYEGTPAGAHYLQQGGGTNYLCMPRNPQYKEVVAGIQKERSQLYSSEYEQNGAVPPRQKNRDDVTPVCAVCRAPNNRKNLLMVPGRYECPNRFRREYYGYLMSTSNRGDMYRSEYVCVDFNMEMEPGTAGNENHGNLFYLVEAVCRSGTGLPCDKYTNGYELTCAVCTA